MCIYIHGSRVFMIARINLLSLAARLTTVSLDISARNILLLIIINNH